MGLGARRSRAHSPPSATGGLWWDAHAQIDVAAVNEEYILPSECRWRSRPLGVETLADLQQKAARLPAGLRLGRSVSSGMCVSPLATERNYYEKMMTGRVLYTGSHFLTLHLSESGVVARFRS